MTLLQDEELREQLRDLPRTDKFDFRYPIDAYEDDLVALIKQREEVIEREARIDELENLNVHHWGADDSDDLFDSIAGEYIANRIKELRQKLKEWKQ